MRVTYCKTVCPEKVEHVVRTTECFLPKMKIIAGKITCDKELSFSVVDLKEKCATRGGGIRRHGGCEFLGHEELQQRRFSDAR